MATTTLQHEDPPHSLASRSRLSRFLALQRIPLEAGERWITRSVGFVAVGIGSGLLLSLLHHVVSGVANRSYLTVVLGELVVVACVLVLNHRGAPQAAARILALSLPLVASTFMILSRQGFRDVAVLMLPASLILSGLLLDRAALVASILLTLACSASVLLAEGQGILASTHP